MKVLRGKELVKQRLKEGAALWITVGVLYLLLNGAWDWLVKVPKVPQKEQNPAVLSQREAWTSGFGILGFVWQNTAGCQH